MNPNPSLLKCTVLHGDQGPFVIVRYAGRKFIYGGDGLDMFRSGGTVALVIPESLPAFGVHVHDPETMRRIGRVWLTQFGDELDGLEELDEEEYERLRDEPLQGFLETSPCECRTLLEQAAKRKRQHQVEKAVRLVNIFTDNGRDYRRADFMGVPKQDKPSDEFNRCFRDRSVAPSKNESTLRRVGRQAQEEAVQQILEEYIRQASEGHLWRAPTGANPLIDAAWYRFVTGYGSGGRAKNQGHQSAAGSVANDLSPTHGMPGSNPQPQAAPTDREASISESHRAQGCAPDPPKAFSLVHRALLGVLSYACRRRPQSIGRGA